MAPKWVKKGIRGHFPIFGFFPHFLGEVKIYIFPIFSLFQARGPEMGSVPSKQDCNIIASMEVYLQVSLIGTKKNP